MAPINWVVDLIAYTNIVVIVVQEHIFIVAVPADIPATTTWTGKGTAITVLLWWYKRYCFLLSMMMV